MQCSAELFDVDAMSVIMHLFRFRNQGEHSVNTIDEANAKLVNDGDLKKVRYNA